MIKLHVEVAGENPEAALNELAKLVARMNPPAAVEATVVVENSVPIPERKRGKAKAEGVETEPVETPVPQPEPEPEVADAEIVEPTGKTYTYDDLHALVVEAIKLMVNQGSDQQQAVDAVRSKVFHPLKLTGLKTAPQAKYSDLGALLEKFIAEGGGE